MRNESQSNPCGSCPRANSPLANAAQRVVDHMEAFTPDSDLENALSTGVVRKLCDMRDNAQPSCESGPQMVVASGVARIVCGKLSGIIVIGAEGTQVIDFSPGPLPDSNPGQ